jgi:hypothetical protein
VAVPSARELLSHELEQENFVGAGFNNVKGIYIAA